MVRDPIYTQLLLGIGIERFCLPPYSVPRVKSILLHTDRSEARSFAEEILSLDTKQEVRERLVNRAASFVAASERT
jgi:phosphoenolpyruvate-protein kinase (PTS system EI component)